MKSSHESLVALIAFAILFALLAAPRAQQPPQQQQPPPQQQDQGQRGQGRGQQPQGQQPASTAKPFIPLAASTLAEHPDAYYGEPVTVTAAVEQILNDAVFSIDQDKTKSTGKDVLVVAPTMIGVGKVDPNTYVTVIGEVVRFDPAEISKKTKGYALNLAPDAVAKFKDKPVVVATSVVTTTGVDVAKRPPPPMTADELALQKIMRQVGPSSQALRGAVDQMNAALAKEHATVLKQAFTQTEAFWKAKGKTDASQWASDARKDAESVDAAVAAGNWDQAKASAGTMNQKCATCHGTYRERMDDGTFRIKTPGGR